MWRWSKALKRNCLLPALLSFFFLSPFSHVDILWLKIGKNSELNSKKKNYKFSMAFRNELSGADSIKGFKSSLLEFFVHLTVFGCLCIFFSFSLLLFSWFWSNCLYILINVCLFTLLFSLAMKCLLFIIGCTTAYRSNFKVYEHVLCILIILCTFQQSTQFFFFLPLLLHWNIIWLGSILTFFLSFHFIKPKFQLNDENQCIIGIQYNLDWNK